MSYGKVRLDSMPAPQMAEIVKWGILGPIKEKTKSLLMIETEKMVDAALEEVFKNFKGNLVAQYDLMKDQMVLNVTLNGVETNVK
jgi:hypothetical protein